jgi:hypothetical protein
MALYRLSSCEPERNTGNQGVPPREGERERSRCLVVTKDDLEFIKLEQKQPQDQQRER